jgi:DNA-binding protein H-NS
MIFMDNLKSMPVDKLMQLREQVVAVLGAKVSEERRALEERLGELGRLSLDRSGRKRNGVGARGAVAPKFRNPDDPSETWAGRGLKPRWLSAKLKAGHKLEEFSIEATAKSGKKVRAAASRKAGPKARRSKRAEA